MRGVGLTIPFQRDGQGSFVTERDDKLRASGIAVILLTDGDTDDEVGELPWRTSFGAGLDRLRYKPNNASTEALARSLVLSAFRNWMREAEVLDVKPERDGTRLKITVEWRWREGKDDTRKRVTVAV